jgi:hypothetical protein
LDLLERLEPHAYRYYVLPGSSEIVNVTIIAEPADAEGKRRVTGVWLDSTNILRSIAHEEDAVFFGLYSRNELTFAELRDYLSEQLVIPPALLQIDAPAPYTAATKWIFPSDRTLSRT